MNYRQFYLGKLPSEQWSNIFMYCLNICNRFKIHLPKNSRGFEKEFYLKLKETQNLDIKPWKGCKQHNEIRGVLNERTKSFFKEYIYQSLYKDGQELWDYQFLSDYREVLYVGDYEDRLVLFTEKELDVIKQQEICFKMWNEHEVCLEMLDERNKLDEVENNDFNELDINSISEAVSSFFNKIESFTKENKN